MNTRVTALVGFVVVFALGLVLGGIDFTSGPSKGTQPESETATIFTCSMHPQVRLEDPKAKCPLCEMDLIAWTPGNDDPRRLAFDEEALALARVETTPVTRLYPRDEVRLYGTLRPDETRVERVAASFAGRIERLFVDHEAMNVQSGDHFAEVYSPELLAARDELRQARLAHERSGSSITRRALDAARERLRLLDLTPAQIEAAEEGRATGDRSTIFSPEGGVVTDLTVRAGDYVERGQRLATIADLSRLWLELEASASQLARLRWGQRVEFTVETHPGEVFEGKISFVEPVVDERRRTAVVRVAVDNADRRLRPGSFVTATVTVRLTDDGVLPAEDFAGTWVCSMHPEVVEPGRDDCDVCGMDLVRAESLGLVTTVDDERAPLVVPRSSVLETGRRAIVYVAVGSDEAPVFEVRDIVTGARTRDHVIVRSGLRERERVVHHGAFKIDSEMQIAGKPSSMVAATPTTETVFDVPPAFAASIADVLARHLDAQEFLARDDHAGFVAALAPLRAAIEAVPQAELSTEARGTWRRIAARAVGRRDPIDIERARRTFEGMAHAMIELVESFDWAPADTVRLAFCPMAFDDRGAEWLQREERVFNPYFGASMLRCGEIRATYGPSTEARDDR